MEIKNKLPNSLAATLQFFKLAEQEKKNFLKSFILK